MRLKAIALSLVVAFGSVHCGSKDAKKDDTEKSDDKKEEKKDTEKTSEKKPDPAPTTPSATATATQAPTPTVTNTAPPPPTGDGSLAGFANYVSKTGEFEIMMPGSVKESETKMKSGKPSYEVEASKGTANFAVKWHETSGESAAGREAARDVWTGMLEGASATPIMVNGKHEGFEITGKEKRSGELYRIRLFTTGKRFFQVIARGASDPESKAWAESFKVAGEVTTTPSATPSGSATADTLPAVCETYLSRLRKCNDNAIKAVPGPMKEQMKKQMDGAVSQTREAWKGLKGPALETACKAANDALKANPNCK